MPLADAAMDFQSTNPLKNPASGLFAASSLLAFLLLSGCATVPRVVSDSTRMKMISLYECTWFHYIDGNEEVSNKLIDQAVELGNAEGLDARQIMAIYNEARTQQQIAISPLAVEIAQQREATVSRIMENDNTLNEPTEEETNQALLQQYSEQCLY